MAPGRGRRGVLNWRAMNATTSAGGPAPPRRLSLVLHPRRDVGEAVERVRSWAAAAGVALACADDPRLPSEVERRDEASLAHDADLVLALGGDGTMLGALRLAAPLGIPVLGANLGRLGYLTEVDGEHLGDALDALAEGSFAVERRFALRATWTQDGALNSRVAYNDVVLSRVPGHGQAALGLSVDGQLLVRYASDGVIAATPSGSTAYSFAAGGPIVSPQTRAMIVTPDAPHGLFNRAVVLGDDESLGIEVLPSSAPVALEVDGRLLAEVQPGWSMEVAPEPQPALVVRLGSAGFAERARRKLGITDPAALADFDLAGHQR
jgi:NAD+ kinase